MRRGKEQRVIPSPICRLTRGSVYPTATSGKNSFETWKKIQLEFQSKRRYNCVSQADIEHK